MNHGMKKLAILLLALGFLSSCNTSIGLGRDLRLLGEGMERKAHGGTFNDTVPEENVPTY